MASEQHVSRPLSTKQSFYQLDSGDGITYPQGVDVESHGTPSSTASNSARSCRSHNSKSPWSRMDASSISSMHSHTTLPALQTKGGMDHDGLEPLTEEEFDPASFDLVVPAHALGRQYTLEAQSELLFSTKHLEVMIFEDPVLLQRFSNFLATSRPGSLPTLAYYLDTLKALKAIDYANSLTGSLRAIDGLHFTAGPVAATVNSTLRKRADDAFEVIANHDLAAYITHMYIRTVSITIKRRITDTLPPKLQNLSEGLAEVFCLTDPSRPDNPIVFASKEFHRTTQYGMNFTIGRNCQFLQGPRTNPFSVRRIREKLEAGQEHCKTFLNYRRDGSPFVNLLMVAPLFDSRGIVRYHLGAQVDVSGLVKECSGLDLLSKLMQRENPERHLGEETRVQAGSDHDKDEFRDLAGMFNLSELKTVRESGGAFHRTHQEDVKQTDSVPANWNKPRLVIQDDSTMNRRLSDPTLQEAPVNGRLSGVYQHYLLAPTGSVSTQSFADGYGITAKVRWLSRSDIQAQSHQSRLMDHQSHGEGGGQPPHAPQGRSRWIHCTPLLGSNGAVGVWMVVLVDDESEPSFGGMRHDTPPVQPSFGLRPGQPYERDEDAMSLGSFAAAHRRDDEAMS